MNILCRHGWHSWRFVSMGQQCEISAHPRAHYVAALTEECRRCELRRYSKSPPIPRRVRRAMRTRGGYPSSDKPMTTLPKAPTSRGIGA